MCQQEIEIWIVDLLIVSRGNLTLGHKIIRLTIPWYYPVWDSLVIDHPQVYISSDSI